MEFVAKIFLKNIVKISSCLMERCLVAPLMTAHGQRKREIQMSLKNTQHVSLCTGVTLNMFDFPQSVCLKCFCACRIFAST